MKRHFKYLDTLRESGRTNMYGAALFLEEERGVSSETAKKVTLLWMRTFDGKSPLDDRVATALTGG